jgi:broad specificity phosphatase PhoE
MTRLILLRHGATDWNEQGRYQGQSDSSLNEQGITQARQLVDRLRAEGIAEVVSSDLERASATARILTEGLLLRPPRLDPRLREIDLGEWEGRLATEIALNSAQAWSARNADPIHVGAPGGETTRQVAQRVWACLDELVAQAPQVTTVVVSHGLALATALCRVRGLPLEQAADIIPENAVPIAIDWPPSG